MKYPIGIQNFESIRRDGYAYVDKTAWMWKMIDEGKYYFLSRPRRFGKSLMVSTLEAFFSGQRELFKGLYVDTVEWDWQQYPIKVTMYLSLRHVKRQKRITVDAVDYYIDLLFFHRELRRLVAIDLKLGKFKPEYEGQMRLYLRYLNQNDRKSWEESPIGLILCSEGNTEHIEYLMLDEDSPIKVAQYYTKLPDKQLLSEKLRKAIAIARENYQKDKEE